MGALTSYVFYVIIMAVTPQIFPSLFLFIRKKLDAATPNKFLLAINVKRVYYKEKGVYRVVLKLKKLIFHLSHNHPLNSSTFSFILNKSLNKIGLFRGYRSFYICACEPLTNKIGMIRGYKGFYICAHERLTNKIGLIRGHKSFYICVC